MKNSNLKKSFYGILFSSLGMQTIYADSNQQFHQEISHLKQSIEELKLKLQETEKNQLNVDQSSNVKKAGLLKNSSGLNVAFYGSIRADTSYQADGGSAPRLYNQINTVPLKGVNEDSDKLKTTLAATRLGLDIKSNENNIGAKLEVDFLGGTNADQFRIRHAYFTYNQWLIGQTWSNFATPEFMPETIDGLGYVGGSVRRFIQLRHSFLINDNSSIITALEDSKDPLSEMRLPALTIRLNQKFDDGKGLFSARAMLSEKRTTKDDAIAWGIGVGVKHQFNPNTELKFDYYHVKGDSSFVAWTNPGVAIQPLTKQIVEESEFDSVALGITHKFKPNLRGTLGYGYMIFDKNSAYQNNFINSDSLNKKLWQGWANIMYNPKQPITFGVEYVYGERETFQNKTGLDNRLGLAAIYSF